MDPALQELARRGGPDDEVAVILRLRDPAAPPRDARIVALFDTIATARVRRRAIGDVWADGATVSVKAPHDYAPELVSTEPADAVPAAFTDAPARPLGATGRGVVIGAVDWGCDVAHPDLRRPDGRTRLLALWDQRPAPAGLAPPYGYGRILAAAAIDAALRTGRPYDALGYDPADFDPGMGSHGAHTISIAAGNGLGGGPVGMAPEADIIFVSLGKPEAGVAAPLGSSTELLEALDFIRRVAGDRPWVCNISLGRHAGEHTGHTLVEQAMDELVCQAPGRAIVQSCGNYSERRTHASWLLRPGDERRFIVEVDPDDRTTNELDIWYPGRDTLVVEFATGAQRRRVPPDSRAVIAIGGRELARAYHRSHDPNNGDHQCSIFIEPDHRARRWEVTLLADDVVDGRVHAWIERDSGCRSCQSRFTVDDADPLTTTGTIANGFRTIAVGAYDAHDPDRPRARFSSLGPTRDGRPKPDLVAPGVMVLGARSTPRGAAPGPTYVRMSGTSMAAPAVTGTVALLFSVAGRRLHIEETRRLLLTACDPPTRAEDAEGLGNGYLDPARVLAGLDQDTSPASNREHVMTTTPFQPFPDTMSAMELFDYYTSSSPTPGAFAVIGAPGQPLQRQLEPGDLVVARAPSLPHATLSVLAGPELLAHTELGARGAPGRYAYVVGGASRESPRLIADLDGLVPPHTVILRPRLLSGESDGDAETDAGLWVPGAERLAHPRSSGLPYVESAPWRFVFHTIEGQPSAEAFRAIAQRHTSPPHLWAMPSADLLLQVIPLDRGAYALAHPPGTVHTNRLRAIQVECWGFARNMGDVPAAMLDWLAERMLRPVTTLVPIDLSEVRPTSGESCYGARSGCRMTDAEWLAFDGVCGHQHVPHNAHWDPGRLDLGYIAARASGARGPLPRSAAAAEAEGLGSADQELEDDTLIHAESEDWAEDSTRGDSARLEWVKLTETPGGKSPVRLFYLLTGPVGGGPSKFCLRVTNINSVYNLKRTSLQVRLRAKTGKDQDRIVPLKDVPLKEETKGWLWVRREGRELEDETSETIELYLDPATRQRAYDSDEPLHWLDVEYHWYEGPGRGRSAYFATRSLPFNLVAPTELLLKEKRFLGHYHLDDQRQHAGLWKFLYSNPNPWPVTYKLTMETSISKTSTGEISATGSKTVTRGTEKSQEKSTHEELSIGLNIENMFSLGQKLASSVTTGVRWSSSVAETFTHVASLTRAFTEGHTDRLEVESKIPAAPAGRRLSIYGYPVVALYEVPVVFFGGANELGQATRRSTGTVPVVWLSGFAATKPILS